MDIINVNTGEKFDIQKATKDEIADYFVDVSTKLKELERYKKQLHAHIKDNLVFKEDADGKERAIYGGLRYVKAERTSLNKKRLEENSEDLRIYRKAKEVIEELKKKYPEITYYPKLV